MSGSSAIPPIRLTLDGKDAVERGMDDIARAADRMGQRTQASAQQMGTLATVADDVGARLGTLSSRATAASVILDRLGQGQAAAGLGALSTVLDSAALAASRVGASAVAAETGVASFFARMATGGVIIGTVVAGLQAAGLGINAAGEGAQRATDYTARYQSALEGLNTVLGTTAERAQAAALALFRTNQQARLAQGETELGQVFEQRSANVTEYNQNQAAIARQRASVDNAERALQFPGMSLQQRRAQEQQLDAARAELNRLETANAARVVRNAELNNQESDLVARLQDARRVQGPDDTYGPAAPAAPPRAAGGGGGGGRAPVERDPETGYTPATQARLDRLREGAEREAQRTAEREQRELERSEERNNRVTDRIVDYSAERFADLFDKNGRGWQGMLETFESTAKSTLSRLAAELILRPVIAPIVQSLGLGQLGTGNGGFSGIGGILGGGGGAVAATTDGGANTGGGGALSGLSQARSLFGSGGSGGSGGGFLGNLGGYINNPIYTEGAGFFASSSAIQSAQFAALGPGMYGPVTGVAPTSGLGGIAGASIGSYATGIGGGYMLGSTIGRYTAGNSPARQQNAQIGAAGGAVAGAIIGSVIPGVGTVIGGLVGGALGGGGGGLVGPGKGYSGGDVFVGVGGDGQLRVLGSGGKRFDSGAAETETRGQVNQINALLSSAGVTIGGMGGGTLGMQGFGQSRNVFGPTEIFGRVRNNLSASNPNLNQVLGQGRINSFDELGQVANFITGIYEPLSKAKDYTKDYSDAISAQLAVYDQAIAKARELGLAEEGLVAARSRAYSDVLDQRNTDVYSQQERLRIAELRLSGNPADQTTAANQEFSLTTGLGRRDLVNFLRSSGVGDETDIFGDTIARYDRVTEGQRRLLNEQLQQAQRPNIDSGRSLMEELTVGGLGGLAPNARYAAGLKVLQDARRSGNLDRITQAARTVLPVARDYLGTSERFGALVADVGRDVRRAGGDPVGLGVFLEGQAAGNQALERIYGLNNSQLSELKGMRQELSRLNAVITTLMQRG